MATNQTSTQRIDTSYPVTPAVVFADHPEWPVYEAPAFWYIQQPVAA